MFEVVLELYSETDFNAVAIILIYFLYQIVVWIQNFHLINMAQN